MIVVTGATGTVGRPLLRELASRGADVRALSRHPPFGEGPAPANAGDGGEAGREAHASAPTVEWRRVDLADRRALADALAGADRLFVLTGNAEDMVPLQRSAIRAAAEAGARRVVKLSALGASDHSKSVIGVWHHVVERELRSSGLAWTILRPHVYMHNLLEQRRDVARRGVLRSPSGDAEIPMIDARDVAAAAAAVLTEEGHEGARYTLTGPAPVSHGRAAEILSEVLGHPVEYRPETEVEAFRRLHEAGLPAWHVGARLALAEYQRAGGGTGIVTDAVEDLTGRPPRSVRDFVHDHADDFSADG